MQKGQRSIVERKIGLEYALEGELQIIPDTQTPETNKITYIPETQQEIQEKTPTPNLCETPNINKKKKYLQSFSRKHQIHQKPKQLKNQKNQTNPHSKTKHQHLKTLSQH